MSKVKVMPEGTPTDRNERIPPMPGSPQEAELGLSSPSTISDPEKRVDAVSEEFAGDLFKIPFQIWHNFNPAVPDEPDPRIIAGVAAPFARVMEKYGLGKIAKDEILVAFYLTQTTFVYVKAAKDAKLRTSIDVNKPE